MLQGTFKRTLLCCLLGASLGVRAKIDEVHFLIPGGAGGAGTTRPVAPARP